MESLLEARPTDAERIAELLTAFGKEMYYAGKPYGRFSETINAVAARKPAIRRNLRLAWDLAFAWQADEPREHHARAYVARPVSVLLALCGLALLWGWLTEAAVFALTWSGLLRIGETLAATRTIWFCHVMLRRGQDSLFYESYNRRPVGGLPGISPQGLIL